MHLTIVPSRANHPGNEYLVTDDNIEVLSDASQISVDMFPLAGQRFRRFDEQRCLFIPSPVVE
jgi:hypothetical protein